VRTLYHLRTMLEAAPLGIFSRSYAVTERGQPVATVSFGAWGSQGVLAFEHRRLTIRREGWWRMKLKLEEKGKLVSCALSSGAFRRGFYFAFGEDEYELSSAGVFSRGYALTRGGQVLGRVDSLGVFSRRAGVDLPEELALEVRLFALWLVLLSWHRSAAAAAAS
jgi:hypothetical protein